MKHSDFSDKTIKLIHSYLINRTFFVSLSTVFLEARLMNCGIPLRIYIRTFFFLYVNDNPQALSNTHTYLHVNGRSIFYQHKGSTEMEDVLNKEFVNACD